MDPVIAPALLAAFSPEALAALPRTRCTRHADGDLTWRLPDGRYHRLDGPAVERASGQRDYWAAGKYHRLDGPAVEIPGSFQGWWVAGFKHRLDGPAVEDADGTREWWVAGHRHRIGAPAVELPNGGRQWWVQHQLHRGDGPAVDLADGTCEWWWENDEYAWALSAALWREQAVREALWHIDEPDEQRAAALALMPTLAPELQRAAIAEALSDRDAELRLWGLRATALLERDDLDELSVSNDDATEPAQAPVPTPLRRRR